MPRARPRSTRVKRVDADSPWIGSSSTAAVRRHGAAAPSGSSRGTALKPGTSGANGACLASCGVAESAPIVRP